MKAHSLYRGTALILALIFTCLSYAGQERPAPAPEGPKPQSIVLPILIVAVCITIIVGGVYIGVKTKKMLNSAGVQHRFDDPSDAAPPQTPVMNTPVPVYKGPPTNFTNIKLPWATNLVATFVTASDEGSTTDMEDISSYQCCDCQGWPVTDYKEITIPGLKASKDLYKWAHVSGKFDAFLGKIWLSQDIEAGTSLVNFGTTTVIYGSNSVNRLFPVLTNYNICPVTNVSVVTPQDGYTWMDVLPFPGGWPVPDMSWLLWLYPEYAPVPMANVDGSPARWLTVSQSILAVPGTDDNGDVIPDSQYAYNCQSAVSTNGQIINSITNQCSAGVAGYCAHGDEVEWDTITNNADGSVTVVQLVTYGLGSAVTVTTTLSDRSVLSYTGGPIGGVASEATLPEGYQIDWPQPQFLSFRPDPTNAITVSAAVPAIEQ